MISFILAGGKGTRLKEIVSDRPKPLAPINNKPFLKYLMDHWLNQGINTFVISVGYMKEKIISQIGDSYKGARVIYHTEDAPLGTGGALLDYLKKTSTLNSDILILNGDTYFPVELKNLRDFHKNSESLITLSGTEKALSGTPLTVNSEGALLAINDSRFKEKEKKILRNAGVTILSKGFLKYLDRFSKKTLVFESEIISPLLDAGEKISVYSNTGTLDFIDIGTPKEFERAKKFLR